VRKITRSVHESARDVARDIAKTCLYRQSRQRRIPAVLPWPTTRVDREKYQRNLIHRLTG